LSRSCIDAHTSLCRLPHSADSRCAQITENMPDRLELSATIKADGACDVGSAAPPYAFQLRITGTGDRVTIPPGKPGTLYLRGTLGTGPDALFLNADDARQCERVIRGSDDWKVEWDFKTEGKFSVIIRPVSTTVLGKDDVLTIDFSNVLSRTAPGTAVLFFEAGSPDNPQTLSIEKTAAQPDIISFYSVPSADIANLPNARVQLHWQTYQLKDLRITRGGQPVRGDYTRDAGSTEIVLGPNDVTVVFSGKHDNKVFERSLTLHVIGAGWYSVTNILSEGDPGYLAEAKGGARAPASTYDYVELQPTLLLNANDQSLYGLFRYGSDEKGRTLLFRTENPLAGWSLVASRTDPDGGLVPEEFGSSPGVYFDDKIWLIGGSQIDTANTSNVVCRYDPQKGDAAAWKSLGPAKWPRRMGHAVLAFEGRIWVMGGCDYTGKALNDVWTLDPRNGNTEWLPETAKVGWLPRCLFSAAAFQNWIWLYGGTREPFSDDLYSDLYTFKRSPEAPGGTWTKMYITGVIGGNPIASSVQPFRDSLHLFGVFRTINESDRSEKIEAQAFQLSNAETGAWTKLGAWIEKWGATTTFSFQFVNLERKMLIGRALAYREQHSKMMVYVPGNT
jgi:hypothetical protein